MRTSKFRDVTKEVINCPRSSSSPLRIHKDSHAIYKPCSPYASSNSHHHHHLQNSSGGVSAVKRPAPVIIYTQSPKIIHTQAHDFMMLVQKLTGQENEEKEKEDNPKSDQSESTTDDGSISNKECDVLINNNYNNNVGYEENESLSKFVAQDSSVVSSMYKVRNNNPYLIDAPFFNPGSSDFFCSSSTRFQTPSMANHHTVSSSFMDFIKGFPDY